MIGAAALWLAVAPFVPAAAQVYVQEDQDFRNSSFIRLSDEVNARLFFADLKAREENWAEVAAGLQQVLDLGPGSVVEFGPRLCLSGTEAARRRLDALPAPARDRYRDLFAPRAAEAARQARGRFDLEGLLRVAGRYPLADLSAAALRAAVEIAHERGSAAGIARALDELAAHGAVRSREVALYARALARGGDGEGVRRLGWRFRGLAAEPVEMDGAARPLGDYLADQELLAAGPTRAAGEAALAVRRALAAGRVSVEVAARLPFEERALLPAELPDPLGLRTLRQPPLGIVDVAGRRYLAGLRGLYRIDGLEGGAAAGQPVLRFEDALGHDPTFHRVSSPDLTPASDGERLYFVFNEAEHTMFGGPAEEQSQLVAVDAESGSRVVFRVRTGLAGVDEALAGQIFEGPPVLFGDLVIVAASRLAENTESWVFAFDRRGGDLVWSRFLASAARVTRYDSRNRPIAEERASPSPLLLADGTLFAVTNVGVIAALAAADGAVRWLFRYNRISPDDPDRFTRQSYYDTGGWLRGVPFPLGERVVAAPEDSRFLYVLARRPSAEGHLVLNDPVFKGGHRALLAVDEQRELLFFAGEVAQGPRVASMVVTATDLDGTQVAETPPFELEERLTGSALLLEGTLLISTNKALYRLDVDKGLRIADSFAVPEGLLRARENWVFGNLELLGEKEVVGVSPSHVVRLGVEGG